MKPPARSRFCRRAEHERPLAAVQRDAGALVDQPDDARELASDSAYLSRSVDACTPIAAS